ncbi:TIGR04222 domain-containing membrane protein [Yinghuangia sp. YIM S10712]|uniref:TIGR04222 domain-containing membrane protein n=1 Tax=Yinghuangia sp. YIM S10712 TaxID=3436930 RepID=UPI003F53C125
MLPTAVILLALQVVLVLTALLMSRRVHGGRTPQRAPARERDLYEVALLGGGRGRVIEVALLRMNQHGRIGIAPTGCVAIPRGTPAADDIEKAILSTADGSAGRNRPPTVSTLRFWSKLDPAVTRVEDRLAAEGLVTRKGPIRTTKVTAWTALILSVVQVAVGMAAFSSEVAFAVLVGSLVLTVPVLVRAHLIRLRTRAGESELQRLRAADPWSVYQETALVGAVALHGIEAIGSPTLRGAMRHVRSKPEAGFWSRVDFGGAFSDGGGGGSSCSGSG